jgi:hypothetical protein
MNIFVLDKDPYKIAYQMFDKHVVKMILETAQLISSVNDGPYLMSKAHMKHPCTLWVNSSINNYKWLIEHGKSICKEYEYRYNKEHSCKDIFYAFEEPLKELPNIELNFVKVMPDEYKADCVIESYRNWYRAKTHLYKWTGRERPEWL